MRSLSIPVEPPKAVPEIRFTWCGDRTFVVWIKLLAECITDDAQLRFNSETGIWVSTFDQVSHIGYVHSNVAPLAFSEYIFKKDKQGKFPEYKLAVDLNTISNILSRVDKDDRVEVCYWQLRDKFVIKILKPANKKMDEMDSEWEMSLVDKEYEELPIPVIEWHSQVKLRTSQFFQVVNTVSAAGDVAQLIIDKDGVQLAVEGLLGSVRQRINMYSTNNTPQLENLKPPATPSIMHMTIIALLKVGTVALLASKMTVKLHFDHESPTIYIEAEFENQRGSFNYYQAGRTKSDDTF